MKQSVFVHQHEALWLKLESWLDQQANPVTKKQRQQAPQQQAQDDVHVADFPADYRQLCHHLALAQSRLYSPVLIDRLNQLVVRGHHQLYASRLHFWHKVVNFFLRDFPRTVRQEWRVVLLSCCLFFGSFIAMLIAVQVQPELIYSVLQGEQVADMEAMYDPDQRSRVGRLREADSDVLMFGHYIRNNTSIGFQSFAGGFLMGLGTLFFMLYNGVVIGSVAGHLTHIGYIETFWGFVAGHSAFELTAIALSGAAGFKLAEALIMPGRRSRFRALMDNSRIALTIIYGAATLFLMAAFVEAFWSSQTLVPVTIKYLIGLALWFVVILYFLRVGKVSMRS